MANYKAPVHKVRAFNCPHCGAFAQQNWFEMVAPNWRIMDELDVAHCQQCSSYSLWLRGRMIHPVSGTAPLPNPDLPPEIKADYEEARSIISLSQRGSAALLRLAIQKLCVHLGEKGKDLNQDISSLVEKGLPQKIQQALDIVRVIGNNAVHPGQINLKDDVETAGKLFGLVNIIAEVMITNPKRIESLYASLPQGQKEAIAKRDSS